MFQFHCHSCKETFRIAFEYLYNKVAIQCPNCGEPVPTDAVVAFRRFSESYMDAIDALYLSAEYEHGFSITIIQTNEKRPDEASEYSQWSRNKNNSFWRHRQIDDPDDSPLPF